MKFWQMYLSTDEILAKVSKQIFSLTYVLNFFVCFLFYLGFLEVEVVVFQDRVSLCSPDSPGTCSVDQAGFKLRHPPSSAS